MPEGQKPETWNQTEDRLVREITDGTKTVREGVQEAREKTIQEVRQQENKITFRKADWHGFFGRVLTASEKQIDSPRLPTLVGDKIVIDPK